MNAMLVGSLGTQWASNLEYAKRLVGDLSDTQMIAQPVDGPVMNHAAWVLAHLNAYAPILTAMIERRPFEDPADHPFGKNSKPLMDLAVYGSKAEQVEAYVREHERTLSALEACDGSVMDDDVPLDRWRAVVPRVGGFLVRMMVWHETVHLGQLSAWRRAHGLPAV